ncbi:hypothetical protein D9M73_185490 [compost metagenome]
MDRSPSTLHQDTTADFMLDGHFLGHIRRMRNLYQARQECLLDALQRHLGGFLSVAPVEAGLHMIGWLAEDMDDDALARGLADHQVYTYALRDYCIRRYLPPGLLLGFAATPEAQAEKRVQEFVHALHALGMRV